MSVLALDIGTSNIKALTARWDGALVDTRSARTPTETSAPGQLAFPAERVRDVAIELVTAAAATSREDPVDTLVFSCLGTAMVPLDRSGRPLGAALSPADTRPARMAGNLEVLGRDATRILRLTGMKPDLPSFLHHWLWWRQAHPATMAQVVRFRSLRGLLVHAMCGADAEDASWASRTMLLDLESETWSEAILAEAGLPGEMLPEVRPATSAWPADPAVARRLGLAPHARIVLGGMDNGCSVLGASDPREHRLVDIVGTYEHLAGTGELAMARAAAMAPHSMVHCWVLPGRYLALSRVPLGHLLAALEEFAGLELASLMEAVAVEPTPERIRLDVEAIQAALATGASPLRVLQGLLQSSADVLRAGLQAWEQAGSRVDRVVAVGGGSLHQRPLELKANLMGRPLSTLRSQEGAALGALRLAAIAVAGASFEEACTLFADPVDRTWRPERQTEP